MLISERGTSHRQRHGLPELVNLLFGMMELIVRVRAPRAQTDTEICRLADAVVAFAQNAKLNKREVCTNQIHNATAAH